MKDAGVAIRRLRGYLVFILQGLERGWRGGQRGHTDTKRQLSRRKTYSLVIEKYVMDIRQGQKNDLDLLESIMKPCGLVKEELQRMLLKMIQFRSVIQ